MRQLTRINWLALGLIVGVFSLTQFCPAQSNAYPLPPAWVEDQTLYEVNLRQFSETGNVEGLRLQLGRLKDLGVGTLWIMPVNPIGQQDRSGKLGSPYAVCDYMGFNPEFGTVEQFKAMIDQAHRMGLHVILDWVANHTAMDHPWITQHPDWYKRDAQGGLVHPQADWKDIAALNFDFQEMRKAMIDAMAYWVREVGVDGFRCDAAEFMPVDFWDQARIALRGIKPVFMLGEAVAPRYTKSAFDASYAWNLTPNTEGIFKGAKHVADLISYINADHRDLLGGGFRLNFTSNHDKNAWEGTTRDLLGDGTPAFTVLTFTLPGMPLIFNGQENGVEHRLQFFEHDPIKWRDDPMAKLYRSLTDLKRNHRALWCSSNFTPANILASGNANVLAFARIAPGDNVTVLINLSGKPQNANVPAGTFSMHAELDLPDVRHLDKTVQLAPWEYRIWTGSH